MFLADYHFHTNSSFDSSVSLSKMAEKAESIGVNEICVTDHFECTKSPLISKNTPVSVMKREFFNAVAKNKGNIKLKFGIELGQPTTNSYQAEMALAEGGFDFVLASVHCIDENTFMHDVDYTKDTCYEIIDKYYDETLKIINWGKFDVLSHFEIFLRNAARQNVELNLARFDYKVNEILRQLAQNGKGLEINTASNFQALKKPLPRIEVLKRFKEYGGKIITVGSDAHEEEHIGRGLLEGQNLAKAAGFNQIAVFERRNVNFIGI